MKKQIVAGLVAISMATASLMAFGPGKGDRRAPVIQALKQLDLTAEQQAALKEMRTAKMEQRKAMREEMQATRDMSIYFTENGFDRENFIKNALAKAEIGMNNRADQMEQIYALLDDTQKKEFVKLLQEANSK